MSNRPIKFRLRIDDKIVGYEKWFAGARNDFGLVAEPQWLYSIDGGLWGPEPIHHREKDQFTGLLDKAGKEIYERSGVKHSAFGEKEIIFSFGCWHMSGNPHYLLYPIAAGFRDGGLDKDLEIIRDIY